MSARTATRSGAATRTVAGVAAAAGVIAAVLAGMGWLYALHGVGALDAGPVLRDALPLQRLAGQGDQPLLRLAAAWVPAGLTAGLVLAAVTRLGRVRRTAVAAACALAVLFAAGAVSDTVTASDPLSPHVAPQLGRAALWVASALFAAGSAVAGRATRRSER